MPLSKEKILQIETISGMRANALRRMYNRQCILHNTKELRAGKNKRKRSEERTVTIDVPVHTTMRMQYAVASDSDLYSHLSNISEAQLRRISQRAQRDVQREVNAFLSNNMDVGEIMGNALDEEFFGESN